MSKAESFHVIQTGVCYPLETFKNLTKMGDHAVRTARRNGLDVRYVGNQGFVTGDAWMKYLEDHGMQSFRGEARERRRKTAKAG